MGGEGSERELGGAARRTAEIMSHRKGATPCHAGQALTDSCAHCAGGGEQVRPGRLAAPQRGRRVGGWVGR